MYLSLLGNLSLWSVIPNASSFGKSGRVEAGRCFVRTSLYKYVSFLSSLYIFIVAGLSKTTASSSESRTANKLSKSLPRVQVKIGFRIRFVSAKLFSARIKLWKFRRWKCTAAFRPNGESVTRAIKLKWTQVPQGNLKINRGLFGVKYLIKSEVIQCN